MTWYWSIAGSLIMCAYWIMERSPVGILAYLPNSFIYMQYAQFTFDQKTYTLSISTNPSFT